MGRQTRGRQPYAPKIEHVEVREDKVGLRIALFVMSVALAVTAFGFGINGLLTPETGWHEVDCTTSNSGNIRLQYFYGAGEMGTAAERKLVTQVYSQALSAAETQLGAGPADAVNLYTISAHPNAEVTVEPLLYSALESYLETGDRSIYYGPLLSRYYALFACQNDEDASLYDPARNDQAASFADRIAQYARDPQSIRLELLGNGKVRLHVSQDYLAFAQEQELDRFLDLGFVREAFVLDAVAQALMEAGLTNALLTAADGYSRCLWAQETAVNLLEPGTNGVRHVATALWQGPGAAATVWGASQGQDNGLRGYTYEDGTVRPSVLDAATGQLKAANANLILFGDDSVGVLALDAQKAMASWNLDGLRYLYSRDGEVFCTDPNVKILREGV